MSSHKSEREANGASDNGSPNDPSCQNGWCIDRYQKQNGVWVAAFKPEDKEQWCYVSGLAYTDYTLSRTESERTAPKQSKELLVIPNSIFFAHIAVWIKRVPHVRQFTASSDSVILPFTAFDALYGSYPENRNWWSIAISGMDDNGASGFPTNLYLYTVDELMNTKLYIGFIDLTDPSV